MTRDGDGLTARQSAFVREYLLSPSTPAECYLRAGYRAQGATDAARSRSASANATRVLALPSVRAAVERGQADRQVATLADVEDRRSPVITRRQILEGLRVLAESPETSDHARVRAYELLGRYKGLWATHEIPGHASDPERSDTTVNVNIFTAIQETAARLRALDGRTEAKLDAASNLDALSGWTDGDACSVGGKLDAASNLLSEIPTHIEVGRENVVEG